MDKADLLPAPFGEGPDSYREGKGKPSTNNAHSACASPAEKYNRKLNL